MKKDNGSKGFTLIELMIAVVIVSLLAGMATYTYLSQLPQIKLRNDAREVNQLLQFAKMRALATGRAHGVVFNLGDGRYYVFTDCDGDGEYAGNDFDDNQPVDSWDDCDAADYDPRVSEKGVTELDDNNNFNSIVGTTAGLEYVLFNHLGQALNSNALVSVANTIVIRSNPDVNGRVDQITVRVIGGTGVSEILPMQKV